MLFDFSHCLFVEFPSLQAAARLSVGIVIQYECWQCFIQAGAVCLSVC